MKRLFPFIFLILTSLVNGQPSCSTTGTVGDIFYANTVSTPTFATNGVQFLCGPNTVVYDTIYIGYIFAHLNTEALCIFLRGDPRTVNFVWLKDNSTLNILPGCSPVTVCYEPLAIINNPAAVPIGSVACTSITFPLVCATGINEKSNTEYVFLIYPNPSSSQINIETVNFQHKTADVYIFNQLGELVLERKNWNISEKEINIDKFSCGLYFIQIKTSNGQQTKKLVINR